MKSFYKENVLSKETFKKIKELSLKSLDSATYTPSIGRWHSDLELPDNLKHELLSIARINFKEPELEQTYLQVVKYQIVDDGMPNLVKHLDKLACTHTLDMCIETTVNWGLQVLDEFYADKENAAVFLKGDEELHYRPEYPSSNGKDYAILLFANYATPDHWSAKALKSASASLIKKFKDSRIDYFVDKFNEHKNQRS